MLTPAFGQLAVHFLQIANPLPPHPTPAPGLLLSSLVFGAHALTAVYLVYRA